MSMDRDLLHRSYTRWWFVALMLAAVLELTAIIRPGPGDTLSAHVWRLEQRGGWEGAAILAVWGWLGWHFTRGAGRKLGWPDLLAALMGLALWFWTIYIPLRQARG